MEKVMDLHPDAHLPDFHASTLRKREKDRTPVAAEVKEAGPTRGKVALFATCYCNVNTPDIGQDIIEGFEHNGIPVRLLKDAKCCGMPKLELGDLDSVAAQKDKNLPVFTRAIDDGYDLDADGLATQLRIGAEVDIRSTDRNDLRIRTGQRHDRVL